MNKHTPSVFKCVVQAMHVQEPYGWSGLTRRFPSGNTVIVAPEGDNMAFVYGWCVDPVAMPADLASVGNASGFIDSRVTAALSPPMPTSLVVTGWYTVDPAGFMSLVIDPKLALAFDRIASRANDSADVVPRVITDPAHPAFSAGAVTRGAFVSPGRKASVLPGEPIADYASGSTMFPEKHKGEHVPENMLDVCDYMFTVAASNQKIMINGNALTNVAALMNDGRKGAKDKDKSNVELQAAVRFEHGAPPRLHLFAVATRLVMPGSELLISYGDQYWRVHEKEESQRERSSILNAMLVRCMTEHLQLSMVAHVGAKGNSGAASETNSDRSSVDTIRPVPPKRLVVDHALDRIKRRYGSAAIASLPGRLTAVTKKRVVRDGRTRNDYYYRIEGISRLLKPKQLSDLIKLRSHA